MSEHGEHGKHGKHSERNGNTSLVTKSSAQWWIYLVQCSDSSFYSGITTNLERRVRQHNGTLAGGARYTRARQPVVLVWSAPASNRSEAGQLEARLKRLTRDQKCHLVEQGQWPEDSNRSTSKASSAS